ncbi:hypothetical protein M758_UG252500 [Ceratodon purpureus]|nr:hypothetical protein M758_UG252500 [Ceratodon purpureus]
MGNSVKGRKITKLSTCGHFPSHFHSCILVLNSAQSIKDTQLRAIGCCFFCLQRVSWIAMGNSTS